MEAKVEGNVLKITLPLSDGTLSKSGKSKVVASTGGFVSVAGSNIKLSINAIKPLR